MTQHSTHTPDKPLHPEAKIDTITGPLKKLSVIHRHGPKIAAMAVVALGICITVLGVRHELSITQEADQQHFEGLSDRLEGELVQRVMVYNYGLIGARNIFSASNSVERQEYRAMVESSDLEHDFPGALGIGYIRRVKDDADSIADFIESTRIQNAPDFEITYPPGAAPMPGSVIDDRLIVEFIEPVERNHHTTGLDIGAHPLRREAVERATLSGNGSISGHIHLVQDDQAVAGFLYILPVYAKSMPTDTPEERLAAAQGWVYMPIIAPPVFEGTTEIALGELNVKIFDGHTTDNDNLIYSSGSHETAISRDVTRGGLLTNSHFYIERPLEIGGRTWTISISSTESFTAASRSSAWQVGIGGALLSFVLGILIYGQGISARRAHTMAESMTDDLRRYANEAGAATRAKSEFLANMSHEIRTPMTAILGYADLLRDDPKAHSSLNKRLSYIGTIKRNGNHLLTIINDILDISKIEAGKLNIERIETSPDALIHEVVSLMAVKTKAKELRLDVCLTTEIPETIQSDPVRLRQILVNLVGNAIKFTHTGSITLALSYDTKAQELSCAVSDTGIGMTADHVARIFLPFEQADASTTREYGGSGLGLQISRRLAEILGGNITVTSEYGQGSIFTLTTPTGTVDSTKMLSAGPLTTISESKSDSPAENSTRQPLKEMQVLLAEDGVDNQRLISFHLKKAGAQVTIVENGKLAVQAMTVDGSLDGEINPAACFDLLLTDMQMPEMDGYTAVRMLRSKGCTLPIVALTAHAMSGDADKCIDAGCDAYASKPIDRDTLVNVCSQAVSKRRKRGTAA